MNTSDVIRWMALPVLLMATLCPASFAAVAPAPFYLFLEPEWFPEVHDYCEYHSGPKRLEAIFGHWGISGPGISAEWTQGGESESNSMAAGPYETDCVCSRAIVLPRTGKYRVWVRYYDHLNQPEPFTVRIEQDGRAALEGELGAQPVVPPNDEYQLYWGFSFGWGAVDGELREGPATIKLIINKTAPTWRQLDAVIVTDDLNFEPVAREKPRFDYLDSYTLHPEGGAAWRGTGKGLNVGQNWTRKPLGGRDFAMWNFLNVRWPEEIAAKADTFSIYDLYFQLSPPEELAKEFHAQFAGRSDVPIMSWPDMLPGFRYAFAPDFSPGGAQRRWLDHNNKVPFFIVTNNSAPTYPGDSGPATYAALEGEMNDRFMGYIHGESIGTEEVRWPKQVLGATRRAHVDALGDYIRQTWCKALEAFYKTPVSPQHYAKSIPCLSTDSMALAHMFHHEGVQTVGHEVDATAMNVPMRIAFQRGAARQFGGRWLCYASGNFGDACNYFSKQHIPRGSECWFHSKYAVTDGVSIAWYRRYYYLSYLSDTSAIYWEQALTNQYFKPGPGDHPVQLTPFGRATEEFLRFVDRLPDRGTQYTPVGILLSYGNGYERMHYICRLLEFFTETIHDRELRELFNACWYPMGIVEGLPAAPDVQSMPNGVYGNIFDILVDRPQRLDALLNYPVIIAAGDVELGGENLDKLNEYLDKGGTLVVNVAAAKGRLPDELLGVKFKNDRTKYEAWRPADGELRSCSPYQLERVELAGATALAAADDGAAIITRQPVGQGALILTLVPHMLSYDERAHASLPFLLNGLTRDLLPVQVLDAAGNHLDGQVMYQLNQTKDGYLVALFNNQGIDKTQHGVARVDRTKYVDVTLRTRLDVAAANEYTQPRDLTLHKRGDQTETTVRVHPGDVQVVYLVVR